MAVGKEQRQQPAGAVVGTLVGRGSCQAERRAQGVETFLFISRPGFEKLPSRTQRLPGLWMRKGNLSGIFVEWFRTVSGICEARWARQALGTARQSIGPLPEIFKPYEASLRKRFGNSGASPPPS